jgi:hypothetical protein
MFKKIFTATKYLFLSSLLLLFVWRFVVSPHLLKEGISQILGIDHSQVSSYSLEASNIVEVATMTQPLLIQYAVQRGSWPINSSLLLQGHYQIKVGFDLANDVSISVDHWSKHISLRLPPPKVLSVEQKEVKVLGSSQAIWTSYSPDEQAGAMNEMTSYVKQLASTNSALEKSVDSLKERLDQFVKFNGGSISIVVSDSPVLSDSPDT